MGTSWVLSALAEQRHILQRRGRFSMRLTLFTSVIFGFVLPLTAQTPAAFDVSSTVVGTHRTPTPYFHAIGKWSDAGEHVGQLSTEVQCYEALGFCEVADARWSSNSAFVTLRTFDIHSWNSAEIIAIDRSALCEMDTIRAELTKKRVIISSVDTCKVTHKITDATLIGGMQRSRSN
jgi:hypothetical protein